MLIRSAVIAACAFASSPSLAQNFWLPPTYTGAPLVGYEDGMGVPLPGATAAEQRAAVIWNVRSGLNVAALQCGFDPTLRTAENYNTILGEHTAELTTAFNALTGYFKRTSKTPALGQKALDTFGTKTYSSFSTVKAQMVYCHAAARVGRIGVFAPRGQFGAFALEHLRTMRNALVAQGEQQFRMPRPLRVVLPRMDEACWKKDAYLRSCGGVVTP